MAREPAKNTGYNAHDTGESISANPFHFDEEHAEWEAWRTGWINAEAAMSQLLKPEDLRVETWPPRQSPGGQHVGTGPSGVKVTHIPTGIEACVELGRSQHVNRLIAVEMIEAALTHPRFPKSV